MSKFPEVLTQDEQKQLHAQAVGARNKAIVSFMLNTGLRASEVCDLRICDLDFLRNQVKVVNGKGGKGRLVGMNAATADEIKAYWRKRKILGRDLPVFANYDGSPLTRHGLYQIITRIGRKAGIGKHVHPHMLRHTFGTDFYRSTRDYELVRIILGHSNIRTTQIYINLDREEAIKAMQTFRQGQAVSSGS